MTYRPHDDPAHGGHGAAADPELTSDAETAGEIGPGELPSRSRRGAHSSDRLSTDTGVHRYTYERPADTPPRTRARHAAPSDDEDDTPPPGGGGSAPGGLRHESPQDSAYGNRRSRRSDPDSEYGAQGYQRGGGQPNPWDEPTLHTAGVQYGSEPGPYEPERGYALDDDRLFGSPDFGAGLNDPTAQLTSIGGGTLTATRPLGATRRPYLAQWAAPEAETEVVEAIIETEVEADAVPAEAEVPFAAPATGGRLRFLGKKHVGLRIAAVSVLVVGSAIGIAVGVLRDTSPDTVKVTDDIQADAASTAIPTPDTDAGQTQAAPAGAELMIKERQQEILSAAKRLAAQRAAAAQSAAAATAKRAEQARASRTESRGTTGDAVPTAPVDCNTYSGNRGTGCALLQEFSFDTGQMDCLDKLWTKESQWTTTAENPSGAYGIPQALPGSKMASVADDWQTNPATQIRWGLGYIKGKYGTPCAAWSTSEATGSY